MEVVLTICWAVIFWGVIMWVANGAKATIDSANRTGRTIGKINDEYDKK